MTVWKHLYASQNRNYRKIWNQNQNTPVWMFFAETVPQVGTVSNYSWIYIDFHLYLIFQAAFCSFGDFLLIDESWRRGVLTTNLSICAHPAPGRNLKDVKIIKYLKDQIFILFVEVLRSAKACTGKYLQQSSSPARFWFFQEKKNILAFITFNNPQLVGMGWRMSASSYTYWLEVYRTRQSECAHHALCTPRSAQYSALAADDGEITPPPGLYWLSKAADSATCVSSGEATTDSCDVSCNRRAGLDGPVRPITTLQYPGLTAQLSWLPQALTAAD